MNRRRNLHLGVMTQHIHSEKAALTVSETAAVLNISQKTVYRLLDRGLLRASKALRHKRIPRTEIDRFLKETL